MTPEANQVLSAWPLLAEAPALSSVPHTSPCSSPLSSLPLPGSQAQQHGVLSTACAGLSPLKQPHGGAMEAQRTHAFKQTLINLFTFSQHMFIEFLLSVSVMLSQALAWKALLCPSDAVLPRAPPLFPILAGIAQTGFQLISISHPHTRLEASCR